MLSYSKSVSRCNGTFPLLCRAALNGYRREMVIASERLRQFIGLYEEEFKEPISDGEAREIASRLIELYQLLVMSLPSEASRPRQERPEVRRENA